MDGVFTGSVAGRRPWRGVVMKVVGVDEGDGGAVVVVVVVGWEALMRWGPDGMGMWPRHMGKLLQRWRGVAGEVRAVMEGGSNNGGSLS